MEVLSNDVPVIEEPLTQRKHPAATAAPFQTDDSSQQPGSAHQAQPRQESRLRRRGRASAALKPIRPVFERTEGPADGKPAPWMSKVRSADQKEQFG